MKQLSFEEVLKQTEVGDRVEVKIGSTTKIMLRTPLGFVWEDSSDLVELTNTILEGKFRILPKFVSFEEAVKADAEGKIAKLFYKGKYIPIPLNSPQAWYVLSKRREQITLKDLVEGQWVIVEGRWVLKS